jgi:hypothetical protein
MTKYAACWKKFGFGVRVVYPRHGHPAEYVPPLNLE